MRLRRSHPDGPGWTRVRHGAGFRYRDEHGRPLPAGLVSRRRVLVIPPAWLQVWICPDEDGHIQAVGVDKVGRRLPGWCER